MDKKEETDKLYKIYSEGLPEEDSSPPKIEEENAQY